LENRIYVLSRETEFPEYDTNYGFVVVAFSELNARAFVSEASNGPDYGGDEPADLWLDHKRSSCECIGFSFLDEQIIMRDFNAG